MQTRLSLFFGVRFQKRKTYRTAVALTLAAALIISPSFSIADEQADQIEQLTTNYLKTGANDPTAEKQMAEAGVDLAVGIVTIGLTSIGIPGAGAALGALKGIFFGSSGSIPPAVNEQFELIKKEINGLKADVSALQQNLNDGTMKSAMDANLRRMDAIIAAGSDVKDRALELSTVSSKSLADRKIYVEQTLNRANAFLDLGDDIWMWDNLHVTANLKTTNKPLIARELALALNLTLTPYLQSIGVLAAAIDATGVRPKESDLKRHSDKLQQLLAAAGGADGNDDAIACRKVAGPSLQDDGKTCHISFNCSSAFSAKTITKSFAAVLDPNYGYQCRYYDNFWASTVFQLRTDVEKANWPVIEAIVDAQSALGSAGTFAGSFDTSKSYEMDKLFAVDAAGKLYKFEHLITTSTGTRPPAGACNPGKISAGCILRNGPSVSHDFSRAKIENGTWGGFNSVVISEWVSDDLLVYGLKPSGDIVERKIGTLSVGLSEPAAPAFEAPARAGNGWNSLSNVFSTGEGVVYGVAANGDLIWYHHINNQSPNAPAQWESHKVGNGWGQFTRLFSPGEGVIYAMRGDGTLLWYKHTGYLAGAPDSWIGPKQVGTGWNSFKQVFTGQDGRIYAVNANGELLYYRNTAWRDGAANWIGPQKVATGWGDFKYVFGAMGGRAGGPVVR